MLLGRPGLIGIATVLANVAMWFVLTTATGLVSGARFPSPAEFWQSWTQINTRGYSMPPRPGAFAELVRIPTRNLVAIADDMTVTQAAVAEPVAVSWHAVRLGVAKLHQPLAACRVVVIGGGAIGLAAALVARLVGAKQIRFGEANQLRRPTNLLGRRFRHLWARR